MKNGLLASLGFLSITSLLVCPPNLSAGVAVDPVAAAAAVRKADADWAAAAGAANVGAGCRFMPPMRSSFCPMISSRAARNSFIRP
jgi:hypothetical protein